MDYSPLGVTPIRISKVGFGCWAIGGHGYGLADDTESIHAIQEALAAGINVFDTADVYGFGHSEEVLSRALGPARHDVVIATKCGVAWTTAGRTYRDCSPARVAEALEGSLRRLRLDCIPLYQLHCHDGVTPIEETMDALCRCRDAGKVRLIGCSNLTPRQVDSMNAIERLSSIQLPFNLTDRTHETALRDRFTVDKMSTLVYGALVRGLLSGKFSRATVFGDNDTRSRDENFSGRQLERNLEIVEELKEAGRRYGKTAAQTALRWVLDLPFISTVIAGMKTADQVASNVGAIGWRLGDEDWRRLARWSAAPPAAG